VTVPHYQSGSKQAASARDFLPQRRTLASLRAAARFCKGCDLYRNASQTVFGEGPKDARVMFVGEQPGDMEDRQGRPFVGPAGRILDKALAEARIDREEVYVTNAVKHFKFIQRGKRRMHQRPVIRQVISCKPWLQAELGIIRPRIVVCLGATAAQSILRRMVHVTKERGNFLDGDSGATIFITIHPSAIYRLHGERERREEYRRFVVDMKLVERKLHRMEERHSSRHSVPL
jgi:uracil-DNA glycosylase